MMSAVMRVCRQYLPRRFPGLTDIVITPVAGAKLINLLKISKKNCNFALFLPSPVAGRANVLELSLIHI